MKKFGDRNLLEESGFSDELFDTLGIYFCGEEDPCEIFPEISLCSKKKKKLSHRKNNKTSTAPQHCNMKKGRGVSSSVNRLSDLMKHNLVLKDRVSDLLMAEYNVPLKASTTYRETCDLWDECGDATDLEQYLSPEFGKGGFPELFSGDQGNWEQYVLFS